MTPADVAFLKEEIGQYDMVMLQLEVPMEIIELTAATKAITVSKMGAMPSLPTLAEVQNSWQNRPSGP